MLQHLSALRFPHLGVGLYWASLAPTLLVPWSIRPGFPACGQVCSFVCVRFRLASPSCIAWCAWAVQAAALVLAGPARHCPQPSPCPANVLSWRASFLLMLWFAFLPTTVWFLALGDLARPRSWSLICVLSSWLASPFLCLLNCDAPLGGVAQCWPSLARGLPLGARYCGRCARVARAAAHLVAWLLIAAAIVIACVLAGSARYCPRPLPCPASILSWHASFLLVPRFAFPRATVWLLALGGTARPRSRLLFCVPSSWLASHLFWAELFNYRLSLSRSSTPPRCEFLPYLFFPLRRFLPTSLSFPRALLFIERFQHIDPPSLWCSSLLRFHHG
ncbi:hypothetical protein V6N12_062316 [Hibiscus sabdariffa]|uniref:Uncharacterized protein n=1 Tax=Hibiscus sabdariffa TaxID=183260 RepID=A0ABR2F8H3_9ROSI